MSYLRRLLNAENSRRLDLRNLNLAVIPKEIFDLGDLTEIQLADNKFSQLPAEVQLGLIGSIF